MAKDKPSLEELKIKVKPAEAQPAEAQPAVTLEEFKTKVQELLRGELARFSLRIYEIGNGEFILYQGTPTNVWARFTRREKIFYRTALERNFEKAGLIDPSNDVVLRR